MPLWGWEGVLEGQGEITKEHVKTVESGEYVLYLDCSDDFMMYANSKTYHIVPILYKEFILVSVSYTSVKLS